MHILSIVVFSSISKGSALHSFQLFAFWFGLGTVWHQLHNGGSGGWWMSWEQPLPQPPQPVTQVWAKALAHG